MQEVEVLDRAEVSGTGVIVEYNKTEAALAALRVKYSGIVFDMATTKGDKEARAARLELVTLRTTLEKTRKGFKAPALEFGKKIDAEAARVTAEISVLEKFIDEQITADETRKAEEKAAKELAEAARVQVLRDKIAAIRGFVTKCQGISADRIANGIELVSKIDTGADVFSGLVGEALAAQVETLQAMRTLHTAAVDREKEAARVEAQRLENEKTAAEQRKQAEAMAAQQAEIDKAAAELKAGQEKLAREQADRDRLASEALAQAARTASAEELKATEAAALVTHDAVVKIMMPASVVEAMKPVAALTPQEAATRILAARLPAKPAIPPELKLGQMAERLGFTLTAAFLLELGFEHSATEKAAKLYHESEWPLICAALVKRINAACVLVAA